MHADQSLYKKMPQRSKSLMQHTILCTIGKPNLSQQSTFGILPQQNEFFY